MPSTGAAVHGPAARLPGAGKLDTFEDHWNGPDTGWHIPTMRYLLTPQVIERVYRLGQGIDTTRLPGQLSYRGDCPTRSIGTWLVAALHDIFHNDASYVHVYR